MKVPGILTLALNVMLIFTFQSSLRAATPDEARAIAKDAWLYAFPMMESYNTWYSQAVDSKRLLHQQTTMWSPRTMTHLTHGRGSMSLPL